ncbi:sugar ABC transporter ATP-binding protein [Nocardioides sp.]|uniref:sugar ABC transporter ATP-binding protein n=1 Tax=Nocardioides sp. TaxID=35761 RepID=UPI0039E3FF11
MTDPILELRNIHKRFGRTHALKGVDFAFRPGEAHALLGENGSGKSTLMKIAYGEYSPTEGEILLHGTRVSFANPLHAAAAGITMVAQEVPVVEALSVAENIVLGNLPTRGGRVDWKAMSTRAEAALAELGSRISPRALVNSLGPGDKQIVAIARAIAARAQVVILDEPTSSLTAERVEALFAIVERMKERGTAIGFISQRLQDIAPVADRVTVIRDGSAVATLPIAEAGESTITRLMVGRDLDDYFHREVAQVPDTSGRDPAVVVRGLTNGRELVDASFEVGPGEIVGFAGLVGSGHVNVVRSIFGAEPSKGEVMVGGLPYPRRNPKRSIKRGMAFVTGDRKREGIVGARPTGENLTLVHNNRLDVTPVRRGRLQQSIRAAIKELQVRPSNPALLAGSLSGGNQQKVVLGRWLDHSPRIFLLDEPTRGVDVGAKSEIYRVLRQLAAEGCAVLVSSSENGELIGLCDRVITLFKGEINADMTTQDLDELTIAEKIAGVTHG